MVSLANESLCNANGSKHPLDNGHIIPVKYKPRKVSAFRDFPPGCGQNVPIINVTSLETTVGLLVADKAEDVVEAHGAKTLEIDMKSEPDVLGINVNPQETTEMLVVANKIEDNLEAEKEVLVRTELIEGETLTLEKEQLCDGNVQSLVIKTESREAEAQHFAEELHKAEVRAMVKNVCERVDKSVLEIDDKPDVSVLLDSEKSSSRRQLPSCDVNVPVKIRSKNKYTQRRVSATRDFPPFCGRNAPPLTEEDRFRINSGNTCLIAVEKDGLKIGVFRETSKDVMEGVTSRWTASAGGEELEEKDQHGNTQRSELMKIVRASNQESFAVIQKSGNDVGNQVEKVGNEIVVFSEEERLSRKMSMDEVDVGGGLDRMIVQGLMAASSNLFKQEGDLTSPNYGVNRSKAKKRDFTGQEKSKLGDQVEKVGNEIVVFSQEERLSRKMSVDEVDVGGGLDRMIVQGLMATSSNLLKQEEDLTSPNYGVNRSKAKKRDFTGQERSKLGSKKKTTSKSFSSGESKKLLSAHEAGYGDILDLVIKDEEDYVARNEEKTEASPAGQGSREFNVTLPPFGPNSSSHGDARNRVRESLRLFQAICRKILQGEESKSRLGEQRKSRQKDIKRIDLFAAKIIKEKGKEVNTDKQILGAVPGVEVGDEFQYRVELAIVGIHRLYQAGIDYMKYRGEIVAASIVASGGYADELDNADVLIYSGQGGIAGKDKQPEDQKLERGNLALKNSISAKNAVRVIRGSKETKASDSVDARGKGVMTYVYDGLYTVDRYWHEVGQHGKLVFKFELRRIPGQPELAWKELKKSKKSKTREGLCVDDISGGKEVIPICAVNTIDDENPPTFSYITKMIYPDHCLPIPPRGCDCKSGCLDGRTCLCAARNGEIPYNFNGAIVEMKPLVHECGPLCKCPPSCCNRVSQHGIRFQLEIFKTESRGWGLRSLNSISAGSFICEYTGELLEDTEAEKRTGNDEYLFDIGQNYNDCSLKPDEEACSSQIVEDGGFTIDAAQCGNVGRFINHSCSPNLYAQNVLYDHEDKRMPHIMFYAAENIPPLQELTYHYNYAVDQVHDSNGNIKMKSCYCGSAECTGRMY